MVYIRMYSALQNNFPVLGLFCFATPVQHMERLHWQSFSKSQPCKSPGYLGCALLLCCRV